LAVTVAVVITSGITGVVVTSNLQGSVSAASALGAGGEYHAVAPVRVLDTRFGVNDPAPAGPKPLTTGAGSVFELQLLGGHPSLPSVAQTGDVLAVAVNITVAAPTEQGYLRAFGKGAAEGESSLVNFRAGQNVPNMAIVRPGQDGKLVIRLISEGSAGTAHVIVDVFGWFSTASYPTNGARLVPAGPGRIYDSRNAAFGGGVPLQPQQIVDVPIRSADSLNPAITDIVPSSTDIVGALVNVTAVNNLADSSDTFVSVVPERPPAGAWPATSNLNLQRGQIKANLVLVPVGADGAIRLFNERGRVHLVVDVVGYLQRGISPDTRAGRVVPLASPFRALDTRAPAFGSAPLAPGKAEDWSFASFAADVAISGEWVGPQSALLGNLTGTDLQRQYPWAEVDTFLTVYPQPAVEGSPPPEASNLNLVENESVPNMALLRYGGVADDPYRVRVYNYNGFVHYILDASAVVLKD
jgi:hypothetical protein